jgi:hypothetical protein
MRWLFGVLVTAMVAAGLSACGDSGPSAAEKAKAAAEQRRAVQHRNAIAQLGTAKTAAKEAEAKADGCQSQAGGLVKALGELNSRLNIGLNYSEYADKVADVRVAYDDAGFGDVETEDFDCISGVGLPAEKALNTYAAAYRTWNKCFESFSCDNDDIKSSLQRRWAKATIQVEQAKAGMKLLKRRARNADNKVERLTVVVRRTAPAAAPAGT